MGHVNIDKVLYTLAEENAGVPTPHRSGVKKKASPETNRVHRRAACSPRSGKPVRKGLARAAVKVVRLDKSTFEVRTKVGDVLIGTVRKSVNRGVGYGFRIVGDRKGHNGFPSQKAAVERMLAKV